MFDSKILVHLSNQITARNEEELAQVRRLSIMTDGLARFHILLD